MTQPRGFAVLEDDFWDDPRFDSLSHLAQLVYLRIWTKVARERDLVKVITRYFKRYLCERFRKSPGAIDKALAEIQASGLFELTQVGDETHVMFPLSTTDKYPNVKTWFVNKRKLNSESAQADTHLTPTSDPPDTHLGPTSDPPIPGKKSTFVNKNKNKNENKNSKAVSRPSLDTIGEEFPTSEPRYPKNAADAAIAVACATVSATAPEFEEEDKDVQVLKTLIQTYREPLGRKARATILQARFGIHAKVVPRLLDIGEERLLLAAAFVLLSQREGAIRNVAGALVNYATANPIPESGEREACDLLRRARRNGQYRAEGALQPLQGDEAQKRPQAPP